MSRHTSTCINFVLLGLQQMLKLAKLGLRTRRGKSVNRRVAQTSPLNPSCTRPKHPKCDWAVLLVFIHFY